MLNIITAAGSYSVNYYSAGSFCVIFYSFDVSIDENCIDWK